MDSLEAVRNICHFISAFKGKVDDALIYFMRLKKTKKQSGEAESHAYHAYLLRCK